MKKNITSMLMKGLSLLSLTSLQRLGTIFGLILNYLPTEYRRITRINIQICFPDLNPKEQRKLAKQSLIETGKTLFELPAFWFWKIDKALNTIIRIEGSDILQRAFEEHKGMLLLSPHLGAWELMNLYLASRYPLMVMYKPPKQVFLRELIQQARQRNGSILVPTDNFGVKKLYRALENNKAVVILPDQDPGLKGGQYAPFFNQPALTMTLVNRLAQKHQPPIFFMYAERLPQAQGFILHFKNASDLIKGDDMLLSTKVLNEGLEDCIKAIPSQYLWTYKRFKRPPIGQKSVYDNAR